MKCPRPTIGELTPIGAWVVAGSRWGARSVASRSCLGRLDALVSRAEATRSAS